ncbi:hypothetical protein J1N35_008708 [Gossypium stocksii]|uniref:Uncharacterized protein n=1 Tax=Gossypium stocksii TaxID=47602 RepID=A0A9D3WBI6_9ROSI|nr:hypothetical protein J1N35_008708 [Gossypium stocksii]
MMRPGRRSMVIPTGNAEEKNKGVSRFRMFPLPEKLVHAIPLILFLCFFILWLLSRPAVNVEMKDGKIVAIHHVDMPLPLTDVTIMPSDSTSSPIPSVPQNLTGNETEAIERIIASE